MPNRRAAWRLCCLAVCALSVLTFSTVVIPAGQYEPMWLGLPRTLWAGIAIYIALTVLTFIGARVYREDETQSGDDAS